MKSISILSKQDYEAAAKRIEQLKDAPADSRLAKELRMLTKAVVQYHKNGQPAAGAGNNMLPH